MATHGSRTTVQDLIDALSEMDPEMEIRAAVQPSYPMRADVLGVVEGDPDPDAHPYEEDPDPDFTGCVECGGAESDHTASAPVAWLVISDHIDYSASRDLWSMARMGW